MAVVIYNAGNQTVASIPARNAITKKFNGMQVLTLDASADPQVGSGKAMYMWSQSDSKWALMWADTYPTMRFMEEILPISGNSVELTNVPVDGVLFSAVILDDNNVILGDANITSVNLATVTLSSNQFSGNRLKVNYGYGSVVSQIQNVMDSIQGNLETSIGDSFNNVTTSTSDAASYVNLTLA